MSEGNYLFVECLLLYLSAFCPFLPVGIYICISGMKYVVSSKPLLLKAGFLEFTVVVEAVVQVEVKALVEATPSTLTFRVASITTKLSN